MTDTASGTKRGFDLTFNLGHAIIIATVGAGLIGSHYLSDYRLAALERKAEAIEAKLDKFNAVLVDVALHGHVLKELQRRLEIVERK